MTKKSFSNSDYVREAQKTGLSAKAGSVYVALLAAGRALAPKDIINKTKLHRQYVYDALEELSLKQLVLSEGKRRGIRYKAVSPERLEQEAERKKVDAISGVQSLMDIYNRSPAGSVDVIRGREAVIEYTLKQIRDADKNSWVDIIGGAGMTFVDLYKGRIGEYEQIRKKKNIKLRYMGDTRSAVYNKTTSVIKNQSRAIDGIDDLVNTLITPTSVSFNIYEPEIMTVTVKNPAAAVSQRKLFEIIWKNAKKY